MTGWQKPGPRKTPCCGIKAIREAPEQYDLKRDLAPLLQHKSNHVVAAAAATAERLEAIALADDLTVALLDLMADPAKRDPGCKALIAIVRALVATGSVGGAGYFLGLKHVQMEGSFGPPVDAAAELRGLSAQGLARMGHPAALEECVTLLVDPGDGRSSRSGPRHRRLRVHRRRVAAAVEGADGRCAARSDR